MRLTDLELCKRIAEIEGFPLCDEWDCCANGVLTGKGDGDLRNYNPLTNKALLFDLMVKYEVFVDYINNIAFKLKDSKRDVFDIKFKIKTDIPRAALECIIKANNGQ